MVSYEKWPEEFVSLEERFAVWADSCLNIFTSPRQILSHHTAFLSRVLNISAHAGQVYKQDKTGSMQEADSGLGKYLSLNEERVHTSGRVSKIKTIYEYLWKDNV